ncbi:MAG TPA: MBL fold metallo-hydrolase [bacterium]|nr:MBL fold metallo-hydrolase [bacterium]
MSRVVAHPFVLGRDSHVHLLRGTGMANTYVLGKKRLVVVDPGAASSAEAVLDFVTQELRRTPADIREIVVTHLHCDHIGGVADLADATGATVALSREAKGYVDGSRRMRWGPLDRWLKMVAMWRGTEFSVPSLADLYRMPWAGSPLTRRHAVPFRVGRWLADREPLVPGDSTLRWKVVASPGHTDDSICLHDAKAGSILTGDVVLGFYGRARFNPFYAFDEHVEATTKKLLRLRVRRVFPGHGQPVTGGIER